LFDAKNVKTQVNQSFTNVLSWVVGREEVYYCFYGLLGLRKKGEVGEFVI
jgi:hypothetical protein